MDLEDAYNLEEELKSDLMAMAENLKVIQQNYQNS